MQGKIPRIPSGVQNIEKYKYQNVSLSWYTQSLFSSVLIDDE